MEENLVQHVPLYGDFFRCLRRLDAPSIDCLTSIPDQVPWFIARLASSAAELENRTVTMCETSDHSQRYRPAGDQRPPRTVTEDEIRGTCNRLIVNGIDTITSYYSFEGLSDGQLRSLNQWVGRCCSSLTGGHQVADIAVLYPIESVWPRFTPARHLANDSPEAAQIESIFHDASASLYAGGRDFTYLDARTLAEAKVENGVLVHGKLRWRIVILPGADTLPQAAWENLSRFVQSGGVLITLGTLPFNSETEFPSARVQALAQEIFGSATAQPQVLANKNGGAGVFLPVGSVSLLPTLLNGILEPDVKVETLRSPIRYTHRRIQDKEVYFIINDGPKPWEGRINLSVAGPGEQCDPATGKILPVPHGNGIGAQLPAYGGAIFRFAKARSPKRLKINNGIVPNLVLRNLPQVSPLVARGEFVREHLAPTEPERYAGRGMWQISATLTKGQTDTFLFLRFPYLQPLQLQDAESLVFDTWVPDNQNTPAQLLVILHEKDGADYLASSGRMLGAPGHHQTFLPLSRFQLAGWSNDSNGQLDLANISEIRVGWGGYYGKEGEKIQFTVSSPQTAAAR